MAAAVKNFFFLTTAGGWGPLECLEFQNVDFNFEVLVLFCSLSGWGVTVSHSSPVTS